MLPKKFFFRNFSKNHLKMLKVTFFLKTLEKRETDKIYSTLIILSSNIYNNSILEKIFKKNLFDFLKIFGNFHTLSEFCEFKNCVRGLKFLLHSFEVTFNYFDPFVCRSLKKRNEFGST